MFVYQGSGIQSLLKSGMRTLGVSQGIQERVQEAKGQDGCGLGAQQEGVQDDECDTHTRNLTLFKRF